MITMLKLTMKLSQLEKEELKLKKKLEKTEDISIRAELQKQIDKLFAEEVDIAEKVLKM